MTETSFSAPTIELENTSGGPQESKRKRRAFNAGEKLRILREAALLSRRGELARLLEREAIYSSHLAAWRKAFRQHGAAGLEPAKPGRKRKLDSRDRRIRDLEGRIQYLEGQLRRVALRDTGDVAIQSP